MFDFMVQKHLDWLLGDDWVGRSLGLCALSLMILKGGDYRGLRTVETIHAPEVIQESEVASGN